MREIKFRAWNGKAMLADPGYKIAQPHNYDITASTDVTMSSFTINDLIAKAVADDLLLMQYTGLKDKNGVEIYEGDVVKAPWGANRTVDFTDGSFWLEDKSAPEWPLPFIEVIGNIYENPELVDKEVKVIWFMHELDKKPASEPLPPQSSKQENDE